ncbi:helix-turn-helix domain-containing protein [Acetobacter tropicalis]|uniref:helix-turn-helix domain-containing protein n=1 Tax=Acetobacter tropicalis TaxID=104102 RepID=UPI003975BA9A
MAEIAHVRVRALHRHIQDAAGLAPSEWLTQQPIACARNLLEETNLSIGEITPSSGFGTTTNFRQHCRTAIGLPPASNRCPFRHHDPTAMDLLSREPDTHFDLTSKT